MASIKDLQDQMNKNSQAWHGANKAEQDRLHKENERLQSQIDSMTGGSSTFNPGTGKWSTTGGSSASRPSGVGGSRPSGGSSSRPSGGNWSTGSNGYGSSYGTDASGQNDYSVLIRDAMNAGASADEVQRLLDQRVNKAQQSGYNQYMYDDLYHAAQNYIKQQTQLPQVEDYSDYLADAFAAQKRAALAQINNAYQQNVNAINRAGEGVDTRYQNARNQAAGASELAARNFNEYAAAAGLNSGAGGQAELARNVALQNNLNDLSTAEAQTYADLEQQMANAEVEYNNAIAEAEANGDAALASALYQEKVRVQQANMEALMQQYRWISRNSSSNISRSRMRPARLWPSASRWPSTGTPFWRWASCPLRRCWTPWALRRRTRRRISISFRSRRPSRPREAGAEMPGEVLEELPAVAPSRTYPPQPLTQEVRLVAARCRGTIQNGVESTCPA